MRRVVLAVGLCVALLLLVGGGISLVADRPPDAVAEGLAVGLADGGAERADGDAPPRRAAVSRAAESPTVAETPAAPAAEADLARPEDVFVPPLPPDVFRDPLRESGTGARQARYVSGTFGVGGRAGAGNTAPRIEARGVVVDATSGTPIAAAELAVFVPRDDRPWGYKISGFEAGADGAFSLRTRSVGDARRRAAELTARAAGYRPWRGHLAANGMRVELEPLEEAGLSGTIVGAASDARGRQLYGPLLITMRSEFGASESQWVVADSGGRFRLEGVAPGRWWVRIVDGARQDWTELRLAAGTEASVDLRGVLLREPPAMGGFGPRREVVVRALPEGVGERAVVRAETSRGLFWRTTVLNGEARFELPRGGWTIVAESPPGTEVRRFVTVAPGVGPQAVRLSE